MFLKSGWILGLFPLSLWASSLTLDGRFEHLNTDRDLSSFSGYFESNPLYGIQFQSAGRLSLSTKDIESWGYALGGTLPWFPFFSTSLRFSEENALSSTTSLSSFLALAHLHYRPFQSWNLFLQGGWYRRFVDLGKTHFLPAVLGSSYSEHDFAVALGTEIHWSTCFSTGAKVATFEELSVYNLNNPLIQADITYQESDGLRWTLYSRYQLLLGFGRMDSFKLGVFLGLPVS